MKNESKLRREVDDRNAIVMQESNSYASLVSRGGDEETGLMTKQQQKSLQSQSSQSQTGTGGGLKMISMTMAASGGSGKGEQKTV